MVLQNQTCFDYLQEPIFSHVGGIENDFFNYHSWYSYEIGWPLSTEDLTPLLLSRKNLAGYPRKGSMTLRETYEIFVPTTVKIQIKNKTKLSETKYYSNFFILVWGTEIV